MLRQSKKTSMGLILTAAGSLQDPPFTTPGLACGVGL